MSGNRGSGASAGAFWRVTLYGTAGCLAVGLLGLGATPLVSRFMAADRPAPRPQSLLSTIPESQPFTAAPMPIMAYERAPQPVAGPLWPAAIEPVQPPGTGAQRGVKRLLAEVGEDLVELASSAAAWPVALLSGGLAGVLGELGGDAAEVSDAGVLQWASETVGSYLVVGRLPGSAGFASVRARFTDAGWEDMRRVPGLYPGDGVDAPGSWGCSGAGLPPAVLPAARVVDGVRSHDMPLSVLQACWGPGAPEPVRFMAQVRVLRTAPSVDGPGLRIDRFMRVE